MITLKLFTWFTISNLKGCNSKPQPLQNVFTNTYFTVSFKTTARIYITFIKK